MRASGAKGKGRRGEERGQGQRGEEEEEGKRRRNLKSTLLIKSQSNKATHCIIPSIGHSGKDKTMGQ